MELTYVQIELPEIKVLEFTQIHNVYYPNSSNKVDSHVKGNGISVTNKVHTPRSTDFLKHKLTFQTNKLLKNELQRPTKCTSRQIGQCLQSWAFH
jgi:hypothetical protein